MHNWVTQFRGKGKLKFLAWKKAQKELIFNVFRPLKKDAFLFY